MLTSLISSVLLACGLLVVVMFVIYKVEQRMDSERANLLESFMVQLEVDRKIRRMNRQVRMSKATFEKMQPEVTLISDSSRYPAIGMFAEYTILDSPNAETGAFFFG